MPEPVAEPVACAFCQIRDGAADAALVLDDPAALAFLDVRPVFEGHVLVIPRSHHVTLLDLPDEEIAPFFSAVQRLARAVRDAMDADGTFVANNNVVSQSVAHLHFHVVPRSKGDGLRGFFWPRQHYSTPARMAEVAAAIRNRANT